MGRLKIDVLLYYTPQEETGERSAKEDSAGAGKTEPVCEKKKAAANATRINTEYLDLWQSTYNVRHATYDFYGLQLEFFHPVDEKALQEYLKREKTLFESTICENAPAAEPNIRYRLLEYQWNSENPNEVLLKDFSLHNADNIRSLEYLLGLINAECLARNIPESAFSSADSMKLEALREIQSSVEHALLKTFNTQPAHFGLAFLQGSVSPPLIVRITNKTSTTGVTSTVLCFQSPLTCIDANIKDGYESRIVEMLSYVTPATLRLTKDGVLLLELIHTISPTDMTTDISVALSDFHRIAEGIAEFVRVSIPSGDFVSNRQIDNIFRLPLSLDLDLKQSGIKWAYLTGRAMWENLLQTTADMKSIQNFIEQIEITEVKDMLLTDQIQFCGSKRMLPESLDLINKISSPAHRVFAIRALAEIYSEQSDEGALKELLKSAVDLLDNIGTYQEKLMTPIRDLLFIFSERLGIDSVMTAFPEHASPQVRLVWLSGIVRSSPVHVARDAARWLTHYSGLFLEMETSPRLFLPLLDELVELIDTLSLIPAWRRYVDDLINKTKMIAELSVHKDYYLHRLSPV